MKKALFMIALVVGMVAIVSSCGDKNSKSSSEEDEKLDEMTWGEFKDYAKENSDEKISFDENGFGFHSDGKGTGNTDDAVLTNYFVCDYSLTSLSGKEIEKNTDFISQVNKFAPCAIEKSDEPNIRNKVGFMTEGETMDFYLSKDKVVKLGLVKDDVEYDVIKLTLKIKEVASEVVAEYKNPQDGSTSSISVKLFSNVTDVVESFNAAGVINKSYILDVVDGQAIFIVKNIVVEGNDDAWLFMKLEQDLNNKDQLNVCETLFIDQEFKALLAPKSMFKCLSK